MPLFSTSDMVRFYNQGEVDVSDDHPFLLDRIGLEIVSDIGIYTLPSYVRSISRVTYRGNKLDPLPNRAWREAFQPGTQQGRPYWYVYNNVGQNQIRLFPAPPESIAAPTDGLWDTSIPSTCIVEFFRITDNENFVIPPYCRDFMLKHYIGQMLYRIEGPGQNLKMSQFFEKQWNTWTTEFKDLLDELHNRPRKLYITDVRSGNWYPGQPVLPIDKFGIGVETGY